MTRERRGRPVRIGELTIVPVERTTIRCDELAGVTYATASKRPVALLLRSPTRQWRIEIPAVPQPESG